MTDSEITVSIHIIKMMLRAGDQAGVDSEPSAFHRAFKRWFDTTVTLFRKQLEFA